jgi:hypothetical protein
VRLIGVALLHESRGLEARGGLVGLWLGEVGKAREQLVQRPVRGDRVEVADHEGTAAGPGPAPFAKGHDSLAREGAQVLLGPEHGTSQRMVAHRRLVDQVLGQRRRLVVGAGDLLDHHASLAIELLGVDVRAPDEVGQEVGGLEGSLGPGRDVEGDEVVARVGVELRAHAFGRLVDVAVGRVLLAALEHQVLEEVGHPVLLGPFRACAGVERDQYGHGSRPLQRHAVEGQSVGEGGRAYARHEMRVARRLQEPLQRKGS